MPGAMFAQRLISFQFRAVFFQIQEARGKGHLIFSICQHNRLAVAGLGDELA